MGVLKRQRGFTVIELVIVIVVIGILAIAAIMIAWPSTVSVTDQATLVMNDIRYAQSLAMARHSVYYFIRTSSNQYQIRDSGGAAVYLPAGSTTVTLYSGISFGSFSNLPNSLVSFDSRGIPYTNTAATNTLNRNGRVRITGQGRTVRITITPTTGRVTL